MTTESPSAHVYAFDGAMPSVRPPVRVRSSPVREWSGTSDSMTENMASCRATSTVRCVSGARDASSAPVPPARVRSRSKSIMTAPNAACIPAIESPMLTPTRTGGRSGSPTRARKPEWASATAAKPGREDSGPVCPNADTRTRTRSGLAASSTSGPSPHRSRVPGRKFSSTMSASRTSARTAARPSSERRSSTAERLFRLIVR
jgi:hypothetical protein